MLRARLGLAILMYGLFYFCLKKCMIIHKLSEKMSEVEGEEGYNEALRDTDNRNRKTYIEAI